MKHVAIQKVIERAEQSKSDSDFTYFFSLLLAAEALAKTIVAGVVASLDDGQDNNRYRLEHTLIRKNGLGDWSSALEDAVSGPASQFFIGEAQMERSELNKAYPPGEWQYEATMALKMALEQLGIDAEKLPAKTDMKRWFRLLATLRNKTRAHGATMPSKTGVVTRHIANSLNLIVENLSLLHRPWAYLYQNLSGKYRVSDISGDCKDFDYLKSRNDENLKNGIYLFAGSPRHVRLMESDSDLHDFYYPNGGFGKQSYELLSYITDDKKEGDVSLFQVPPGTLPASETEGYGELLVRGECFSNAPEKQRYYIDRPKLESEIEALLMDDRHPVITLVGRGGIGKTSIALKVIHDLFQRDRYESIVWLSARDVDLHPDGPKQVRSAVLTIKDIANLYSGLVLSEQKTKDKKFKSRDYFGEQLQECEIGQSLFVFDNFETVQNPIDAYNWIETYIRSPNKVLITTRLREFRGDYHVEVGGMNDAEAENLINQTATYLMISDIITAEYRRDLIVKSEGHPYVLKILLGEVAKERRMVNVKQLISSSEHILTALFERTYAVLSPCAQRAFLTLSGWNSAVPLLALKVVLTQSTQEQSEVASGIESLLQFSIAEIHKSRVDGQDFISLPLVAREFGRKKLNISVERPTINSDIKHLQMFGATNLGDPKLSLLTNLKRFIANISREENDATQDGYYSQILEAICQTYNQGRLLLAKLYLEKTTPEGYGCAAKELNKFLEENPPRDDAGEAWRLLAHAYSRKNNHLGDVHASIERATIVEVPFCDLSSTANKLNRVLSILKEQGQDMEKKQKHDLADRLATVLRKRKHEADATDLSRMAWLEFHRGQQPYAREYVVDGLKIDPNNIHLQNLADRLGIDDGE